MQSLCFIEGELVMVYRLFFVLILFICAEAIASQKELSGSYTVAKAPYAESDENTHLYLFLAGSSAKDTWDAMNVKPVLNPCGVNHMEKSAGDLVCSFYESSNTYECSLLINVKNGAMDGTIPC